MCTYPHHPMFGWTASTFWYPTGYVHPMHSKIPIVLENYRNCRNSFIYIFLIRSHAATEEMTEYVNELMLPCVRTRSYQELCVVQERVHRASQSTIEIASSVVAGESFTGRTDVDTLFPDGEILPEPGPKKPCGAISWERPKAPFSIGSHTSKRAGGLL